MHVLTYCAYDAENKTIQHGAIEVSEDEKALLAAAVRFILTDNLSLAANIVETTSARTYLGAKGQYVVHFILANRPRYMDAALKLLNADDLRRVIVWFETVSQDFLEENVSFIAYKVSSL